MMNKEEVLKQLARVTAESEKLLKERNRLIVHALSLGAPVAAVARSSGVSRAQVYNIKKEFTAGNV